MGNVVAIRQDMPMEARQRACAVSYFGDEAATLFPDLAREMRRELWRSAMGSKDCRGMFRNELGRHFTALEGVILHLHGNSEPLYKQAMESFLTIGLAALRGRNTRDELRRVCLTL